jgi:hypothetical protein
VERGGVAVGEDGARADGDHRRQPSPVRGEDGVAHRIHAAVKGVKAAALPPHPDRTRPEADAGERPARHHPVLAAGERREGRVGRGWLQLR